MLWILLSTGNSFGREWFSLDQGQSSVAVFPLHSAAGKLSLNTDVQDGDYRIGPIRVQGETGSMELLPGSIPAKALISDSMTFTVGEFKGDLLIKIERLQ